MRRNYGFIFMMLFWVAANFLQMQAMANSKIALKAYNGKYVCADGNKNYNLVADRTKIDAWEIFEWISLSEGKIALMAYNGKYVCADGNKNYNLIADQGKIDTWETFELIILGGGKIALMAHNGKYLCADGNRENNLVADRDLIKEWETFEIIQIPNQTSNEQSLNLYYFKMNSPEVPTDTVTVYPNNITYIPPHINGDQEFAGHGPKINCSVRLFIRGLKLYAQINMNAVETVDDFTEASGYKDLVVYDTRPVLDFANTIIDNYSEVEYTDNNEEDDPFVLPPGSAVNTFIFRGDTQGSEAGIRTRVMIFFNGIELIFKK
jgi:hypothetical protein